MTVSKLRVLVIDDDPDIVAATEALLADEGFETSSCRNGRDALDWLYSHEAPSCILLDVKMPLMDGWTLWQESRYVRGIRDVPVIIMTADTRMERMAELTGVAGFVHKPFDVDALIALIHSVIHPSEPSNAERGRSAPLKGVSEA